MTKLNSFLAQIQTDSEGLEIAKDVRSLCLIAQELAESLNEYAQTRHLHFSMEKCEPMLNKPGWYMSKLPMGFENGTMAKESMGLVEGMIPLDGESNGKNQ